MFSDIIGPIFLKERKALGLRVAKAESELLVLLPVSAEVFMYGRVRKDCQPVDTCASKAC